MKAWGSLVMSAGLSIAAVCVKTIIPFTLTDVPLWILYGAITGTVAVGCRI